MTSGLLVGGEKGQFESHPQQKLLSGFISAFAQHHIQRWPERTVIKDENQQTGFQRISRSLLVCSRDTWDTPRNRWPAFLALSIVSFAFFFLIAEYVRREGINLEWQQWRSEGLMRDGMMKGRVCHRQAWVGCRRREREGKKEWDLASHFVDRLNKSTRAHWSTLIELHKWDREGGTHGKAATKQQQGWADHSFRHFLKLIIHAAPSLPFFYLHLSFWFSVLFCLFPFSSPRPVSHLNIATLTKQSLSFIFISLSHIRVSHTFHHGLKHEYFKRMLSLSLHIWVNLLRTISWLSPDSAVHEY